MLRKIFQKITKQSIFQKIMQSPQLNESYLHQAMQHFSSLQRCKKHLVLQKLFITFKKPHSSRTLLTTLLLIDYVSSLQPQITLFQNCHQPKLSEHKNKILSCQQLNIAQESFIKVYFQFQKAVLEKTWKEIDFNNCEIDDFICYCELSINQILQIIKIDFVINFLIKHTPHTLLIKLCLQSIFQKVSFDIRIINKFLDKYLWVVTKKHAQAFRINEIYEKLLYVNKGFPKFNVIAKHLSKKIIFEPYKIDSKLNKSVQIQMYQRQQQKRDFKINSHKRIRSQRFDTKQNQLEGKQQNTIEGDTMIRLNDFI